MSVTKHFSNITVREKHTSSNVVLLLLLFDGDFPDLMCLLRLMQSKCRTVNVFCALQTFLPSLFWICFSVFLLFSKHVSPIMCRSPSMENNVCVTYQPHQVDGEQHDLIAAA